MDIGNIGMEVIGDVNQRVVTDEYFRSYENLDVHRVMLEDSVRTNLYKDVIEASKDYFKGKVVMDVGAGTGILSLMCAKAGASKVIAVEASRLALILPAVVETNGFAGIIEVVHAKVEDVTLAEKVDIIVSEWMGFYLLHESMLESVLYARDNFLKPGSGVMLPTSAQIFAAPCAVPDLWKQQIGFWKDNLYGFDLSLFGIEAQIRTKPEIYDMPVDGLLSEPQLLWSIDLLTVTTAGLQKFSDYRFFQVDVEEEAQAHGVCLWFTCQFPALQASNIDEDKLELSTAPWDDDTHWKQTVILFPQPTKLEPGDIIGWKFVLEKESLAVGSRSYRLRLEMILDAEEHEHPTPCQCGSSKCTIIKYYLDNNQGGDGTSADTN